MSETPPLRRGLPNSTSADFIVRTRVPSGTIPVGTTASMKLYNPDDSVLVTITGVLSSDYFEFRKESAVSDLWPDRVHYRIYTTFPDSPNAIDLLWYFGDIQRIG